MRQASQASINPRSSPQGANKRLHGPIPPNWPRRAAQSRRDLCLRRPQTYRARFYTAWIQSSAINPRRIGARYPAARRPVEHPFGNFKAAGLYPRRLSASKCPRASPGHHFVHEHPKAEPWMPGIKYFPFVGPVGVMLSSCTAPSVRMPRSATSHLHRRSSCRHYPRGRLRYADRLRRPRWRYRQLSTNIPPGPLNAGRSRPSPDSLTRRCLNSSCGSFCWFSPRYYPQKETL
jgi:hypothetical protein